MWQLPVVKPELACGEVHLWRALCVPTARDLAWFEARLTPTEMARARRLATDTLRRRYLQAHTLLHTLLRAYTQSTSPCCELACHAHGKPYLVAPQLHPPLEFNMSHAGEMVLIALARGSTVGVDIETIRPLNDLTGMITACCTAGEQAYLAGMADAARLPTFYWLWTRKEAWLKMRGVGLGEGLSSVETREHVAGVTLMDVPLAAMAEEYVGALALPEADILPKVTFWDAHWQSIVEM